MAYKLDTTAARKVKETVQWVDLQRLDLDGDPTETQLGDEKLFPAVIVATSGTEYTDERYTVQRAYIANSGDAADAIATVTPYASGHPMYLQIVATNLGESSTHDLDAGDMVMVYHDWDKGDPAKMRYVFDSPTGGYQRFQYITDPDDSTQKLFQGSKKKTGDDSWDTLLTFKICNDTSSGGDGGDDGGGE